MTGNLKATAHSFGWQGHAQYNKPSGLRDIAAKSVELQGKGFTRDSM